MLNKSGITKTTYGATTEILANPELQSSIGCVIAQAVGATIDGKKIVKAGTPVTGVLGSTTAFIAAETTDTGTKGIYTVQITAAATADDKITIEGVDYICAAVEDITNKKFAGATAAAQVTSLLKMVACNDFVVAADSSADKIKFTQKIANTGDTPTVTVTKGASGTITIGSVTAVETAVSGTVTNNAVGVILHDVDVTAGNANATVLIFGFVNKNRLDAVTKALITAEVEKALAGKITFVAL